MVVIRTQGGFFYPILFIPTLVFLVLVVVGYNTYKNNQKQPVPVNQKPNTVELEGDDQTSQATPASETAQPTQPSSSPAANPKTNAPQSSRYLKIPQWGIKIKYTAEGSYNLKYFINDDATLYLTTDQLETFANNHPECSDADRGTLYNRITPGGYDYTGKQWDESGLQAIQANKVHGFYYAKFAQYVCATTMPNVSFETQQEYIYLGQNIPWHDAVETL